MNSSLIKEIGKQSINKLQIINSLRLYKFNENIIRNISTQKNRNNLSPLKTSYTPIKLSLWSIQKKLLSTGINNENKKETLYLVTGATGFLGNTLCRELVSKGEKVRAFVLPDDKSVKYLPKEIEICYGDLCDKESVNKFFNVDPNLYETICLHNAACVSLISEYNQKVMDINLGGTNAIIDACQKHKECKKLVYCSSTTAIPDIIPKPGVIRENKNFNEKEVVGCYSISKALASKAVIEATENGLDACIVHPSGIFGPNDYAVNDVSQQMINMIKGKVPMAIAGSFNLCDVRDVAHGIVLASQKGKKGECYILANDEISFEEFAKSLAKEANCEGVKHFIPLWLANGLAHIMEFISKFNGKEPQLSTFTVYTLARNNNYSSEKAKKELGYTTRSLKETIRDEALWLKNNGLLD